VGRDEGRTLYITGKKEDRDEKDNGRGSDHVTLSGNEHKKPVAERPRVIYKTRSVCANSISAEANPDP
jgi:hypothetical protein